MRVALGLWALVLAFGCNEILEVATPMRGMSSATDDDAGVIHGGGTATTDSDGGLPSSACEAGATQCVGTILQQCADDGSMVDLGECHAGCEEGRCLQGCEEGVRRCDGRVLQLCKDGLYQDEEQCTGECSAERGCEACEEGSLSCSQQTLLACEDERYESVQTCNFDCTAGCGGHAVGRWEAVELCEDSQWLVEQYYENNPRPDLGGSACDFLLEDAPVRFAGGFEVTADGEVRSDLLVAQDQQLLWAPACFQGAATTDENCDAWAAAWNQNVATTDAGETFKAAASCQPSGDSCTCRTVGEEQSVSLTALQNYCVADEEMRLQVQRRGILQLRRAPETTWLFRASPSAGESASAAGEFGAALASDGDTLVVGATGENDFAGAAYVFVRDRVGFRQQARLVGHNTESLDYFGYSVAISGDTIAVGASDEASGSRGVNGSGSDNDAPQSGAVYVFTRSGETWAQQAYLKAHNSGPEDRFGGALGLEHDLLVVTAENEESAQVGTNSDGADNSAVASGAAYAFMRTTAGWQQEAYLKAENPQAFDFFGTGVAVSGDTIAISSREPGPENKGDAGAVHVFIRDGGEYRRQAAIYPRVSDRKDFFGYASVALWGDWLAVGAPADDSLSDKPGTIAGGERATTNAGAVWLYKRSGQDWAEAAYVKAPAPAAEAYFGSAVALVGDTLLIGAEYATAPGGAGADDTARAGGAYLYGRDGADTAFSLRRVLHAPNPDPDDRFGMRVQLIGGGAVVTAFGEDGSTSGVHEVSPNLGATLSGNDAEGAGAAYVFF